MAEVRKVWEVKWRNGKWNGDGCPYALCRETSTCRLMTSCCRPDQGDQGTHKQSLSASYLALFRLFAFDRRLALPSSLFNSFASTTSIPLKSQKYLTEGSDDWEFGVGRRDLPRNTATVSGKRIDDEPMILDVRLFSPASPAMHYRFQTAVRITVPSISLTWAPSYWGWCTCHPT